jgi:hypothetical protein
LRFCSGAYGLTIEITLVTFDDESIVVKECLDLCWKEVSLCERGAKGTVRIGGVLEVHHDGFDLGCWVVAEVLAISVARAIARVRNSSSAVPFGGVAGETSRVGQQHIESESTGARQVVVDGSKPLLGVLKGVEVVPDVERRNYQGKPPAKPKLTKVTLPKLDPVAS